MISTLIFSVRLRKLFIAVLLSSVPALRADDFRVLAVEDGQVVPQEMAEGDVMPAVEAELLSLEGFENPS